MESNAHVTVEHKMKIANHNSKVIHFNVSNTNAAFITIRILGVTTLDIVRANTFVAEVKVKIQHFL